MSKLYNTGVTVTEKLGLDSEVKELKLGSSFTSGPRGPSGTFHTIKYDFKPASVDKSKSAALEVGGSNGVMISMPHYDNNGSTVFKGSTRPYTKECVLIIDRDTGEFTLEKLSHNVQVKKTRQEGGSSKTAPNKPPAPAPAPSSYEGHKQQPPAYGRVNETTSYSSSRDEGFNNSKRQNDASNRSSQHFLNSNPNNSGNGMSRKPNSPAPPRNSPIPSFNNQNTTIPSGHSPSLYENNKSNSSAAAFDALKIRQSSSGLPSLTSFEDLLTTPAPIQQQQQQQTLTKTNPPSRPATEQQQQESSNPIIKPITPGEISDSSSDSSSSSSSEDEDDSSSASDMEEVLANAGEVLKTFTKQQSPPPPQTSSSYRKPTGGQVMSGGGGRSMPSMPNLGLDEDDPMLPVLPPPAPPTRSMPMPSHLLSEDLQLSESGSDSDSD